MGCGFSKEKSPTDSKQTYTQNTAILPGPKQTAFSRDGLDPYAKVYDDAPPNYEPTPSNQLLGFRNFPPGATVFLNLFKKAADLRYLGHSGAWNAVNERHGQVWLDLASTLRPVTKTAILLYAAVRLLVAKALRRNITFFFTTFPNSDSEQLEDSERSTLKALMNVFNAKTFRRACDIVRENATALKGQGLENFASDDTNFLENDTPDEKLVKLLAFTRDKIKAFWHGWDSNDLDLDKLQSLYRTARSESKKQPKLLNNTSFIYQIAVEKYKRQLESKTIFPLTCTFLLGTRLEPAEVQAIQQCQVKGSEASRQAAKGLSEKTKVSLWGKPTQPGTENTRSAVTELELVDHPFCIQAIVFCDHLNVQAKRAYEMIDNFLDGRAGDINDVTYVSETTTSNDPRVDSWEELRSKPQYNREFIADAEHHIYLPGYKLIRRVVFNMVDDDDDDDEDQYSNDKTREPRQDEIQFANGVKLGTTPNVGS